MFTGHRPQNLPFQSNEIDPKCQELKDHLKELILEQIDRGFTHFMTGMALGMDTYAAEIVLYLRKHFPQITLEAVIPCKYQTYKWNEFQINRYFKILGACDKVTILQEKYTKDCMLKRNRYMVDHSDCMIAVWGCSNGGTAYTVNYANKKEIEIVIMHPYTYSVMRTYEN